MHPREAATGGGEGALRLSVVLPVLNEARDLARLLDALQAQSDEGVEVLVVDGGSTDGTRELVRKRAARWPELRLLENPRRRSSSGRNLGWRAARGEYVLFLDGHCRLLRDDYLERLLTCFRDSGADCLCRPQPLDRLGEGEWPRAIAAARHSPLGHAPGSDIFREAAGFTRPESAGAAYPRRVLKKLGGFDERFDACEDVELNHRLALSGGTAYVHPDLAVAYRPRETPGGLFRQMMRYGRGRARLWARHPDMVPWPLVVAAAGAVLLVVLFLVPGGAEPAAVVGLAYVVGVLAEGVRATRRRKADPLRTAVALILVHAGLVAGFLRGLPEVPAFRGTGGRGGEE